MALEDFFTANIGPLIVGVIVALVVGGMYSLNRTRDFTITGRVQLDTVNRDLDDVKKAQKDGFDQIKDLIETKEAKSQEWKNQILEKLNSITIGFAEHGWRIDAIEKELTDIRDKEISSIQSELGVIYNHKSRISYLEEQLRELKDTERYRHKSGGDKAPI